MKTTSFRRMAWIAVIALTLAVFIPAGVSAALYELDYSLITDGGGMTSSATYSIDTVISTTGVDEGAPQTSATYSVESVLVEPEAPLAVDSWIFY